MRHRALLKWIKLKNKNNLDLIKFYRRQRMVLLSAMSAFSTDQRRRLERLSVIRDSELMQTWYSTDTENDELRQYWKNLMPTKRTSTTIDKRINKIEKLFTISKKNETTAE